MSTPYEGYRRKLAVHTAEGDAATLIVTVQRDHRHGPVWLSFGATTTTTVALSGAEVGELTGALHAAAAALTADVMRRVLQAAYDVDRVRRRSGGAAGGVEGA